MLWSIVLSCQTFGKALQSPHLSRKHSKDHLPCIESPHHLLSFPSQFCTEHCTGDTPILAATSLNSSQSGSALDITGIGTVQAWPKDEVSLMRCPSCQMADNPG